MRFGLDRFGGAAAVRLGSGGKEAHAGAEDGGEPR